MPPSWPIRMVISEQVSPLDAADSAASRMDWACSAKLTNSLSRKNCGILVRLRDFESQRRTPDRQWRREGACFQWLSVAKRLLDSAPWSCILSACCARALSTPSRLPHWRWDWARTRPSSAFWTRFCFALLSQESARTGGAPISGYNLRLLPGRFVHPFVFVSDVPGHAGSESSF